MSLTLIKPITLDGPASPATKTAMIANGSELTPAEVAREFKVSPATVRRWEESGLLKPTRRLPGSRHRRYSRESVNTFKAELATAEQAVSGKTLILASDKQKIYDSRPTEPGHVAVPDAWAFDRALPSEAFRVLFMALMFIAEGRAVTTDLLVASVDDPAEVTMANIQKLIDAGYLTAEETPDA